MQIRNCAPKLHKKRERAKVYTTNFAVFNIIKENDASPRECHGSVQYAIGALLDKQLLTYQNEGRAKIYSVPDRFMQMWICRIYG